MASAPTQSPILPCVDHALPYQVIFEEHRERRPKDLLFAMLEAFPDFYPTHVRQAEWDPLINKRKQAFVDLNARYQELADRQAELGQLDAEVQRQSSLAVKDLQKQVDSCEANFRASSDDIWAKFTAPLAGPSQEIKDLQTKLDKLIFPLTGLRILLADLNAKQFKGFDLTDIFAYLDQKKTTIEERRDQLREELANCRWEWSRLQEELWQPLSRQANLVTAAYAMLKQKKAELSNVNSPFDSLREIEIREKQTQYEIAIFETRCSQLEKPLRRILHRMDCSAVCLSGGGIRSASFSLGVLQGLSRFSMGRSWQQRPSDTDLKPPDNSLMANLDYLSTVSGGGYIGSWLMAWAQRVSYPKAISELASLAPTSPEPEPVRRLREYTSHLAPKYGMTIGAATLVSTVLRNVFVNWLILVPTVIALACLPYIMADITYAVSFRVAGRGDAYFVLAMAMACVGIIVAGIVAAHNMRTTGRIDPFEPWNLKLFIFPLLLAAWLVGETWLLMLERPGGSPRFMFVYLWILSSLVPFTTSIYRAYRIFRYTWSTSSGNDYNQTPPPWWKRVNWFGLLPLYLAPLVSGLISAILLLVAGEVFARGLVRLTVRTGDLMTTFQVAQYISVLAIVPTILLIFVVSWMVTIGLSSSIQVEEEREWWSVASGVTLATSIIWFVLLATYSFPGVLSLLGTKFPVWENTVKGIKTASITALISGGLGVLSALKRRPTGLSRSIAVTCFFGMLVVIIDLTRWLRYSVQHFANTHPEWLGCQIAEFAWEHPTIVVCSVAAGVAVIVNRFINVNMFSLHAIYRVRLVKCFLGAANLSRRPNPLTNFDQSDDLLLASLRPDGTQPLLVLNAAVRSGQRPMPFEFTPVHCGSRRLGYLPTSAYGGVRGVRLGTAMSISGVDSKSEAGYYSSAAVTLAMTFFNARLGWWLPSPAHPYFVKKALEYVAASASGAAKPVDAYTRADTIGFSQQAGPVWGLAPLIAEALGRTDDTSRFIQLSDGGDFENLGLYEMVMRRCRSIIVVDATQDEEFQFAALGNAMRKIYLDFGIPIYFPDHPAGLPMKKDVSHKNLYCLSGVIDYGFVDPEAPRGSLIYFKPVLLGTEPEDIRSYAANNTQFPHESTTKFIFNEAQFESYRHLGSWAVDTITREQTDPKKTNMQAFVELAHEYTTTADG